MAVCRISRIALARARGFAEIFSMELEFYLLPKPIAEICTGRWNELDVPTRDIHCYSVYEGHFWEPVMPQVRECFADEIEGCIPESGQGQFEINLHRSDALSMADTTILFKSAVKQVAAEAGLSATFMAKWHDDYSGNSGHIHRSLQHAATDEPAFYAEAEPHHMSAVLRHYDAGLLDVFRPSTLFFAPFVNSYKRFQLDNFAGVTQTWAIDNRTAGVRVNNDGPAKSRAEHRMGGADLNPYLAFATCLGAGLRGIDRQLPLGEPGQGNCYHVDGVETVPMTLAEALVEARDGAAMHEILPSELIENMAAIAAFETSVFDSRVNDVERRRYFEMA